MQAEITHIQCQCGENMTRINNPNPVVVCENESCPHNGKEFIAPTITLREYNDQTKQQGSEG